MRSIPKRARKASASNGGPAVLRSGASPGDVLHVTGPLGAAAASGWTQRRPARVAEGVAARLAGATAMIDVSDGLAADLWRLASASGVGFELDGVPVADGATLDQALAGGEDLELVFALPAGAAPPPGSVRLGVCVPDPSVGTLRGERLEPRGWEHQL